MSEVPLHGYNIALGLTPGKIPFACALLDTA